MERNTAVIGRRHTFTLGYFAKFVSHLRDVYHFTTYREGKRIVGRTGQPLVIMRHDIDIDLEVALGMASLERDLGIHSTYFFMVRCPLYNVFSSEGSEQVKQILAAGHHFGLHFDCSNYQDVSIENIDYYVSRECQLLEHFFEQPIEAVSFHRPAHLELGGVELERWPNSYEKVFAEKFEYFSDSRGIWAYGDPLDSEAFRNRENLHILIHPVWWTSSPMSPREKLDRIVAQMGLKADQYLSDNSQVWKESKPGGQA